MSVKQVSADTAVAPNLVPMVDIMFLLLLFFMLGADLGQRELEEVLLPKSAQARVDEREDVDRVIVNVHREGAEWRVAVRGQDRTAPGALEATLAGETRGVLIRADGEAAYEHVQRVMEACAKAGLARVELAAAKPAAE